MKLMKFTIATLLPMLLFCSLPARAKPARMYYQITVYHYANAQQENLIDGYLKNHYLPALHKLGIAHVGVFKPLANDTAADKRVFVLRAFKSMDQLGKVAEKTWNVNQYGEGDAYINSNYKTPPYTRIESMVIQAFAMAPNFVLPKLQQPKADHIYEFRSYESATEKIHNNKVHMFNEGDEIGIFARLNFNPVFYGVAIAGCHMPNLVYMTSFENRAERDEHWKAFSADPAWKKLLAMPEYQNNVSRNETVLMKAAEYSDF